MHAIHDQQMAAATMPERPKARTLDDERDETVLRKRPSKKRIAVAAAPPPPPPPRPDRAVLNAAEEAKEDAQARYDQEGRDLRKRQEALEQERRQLDRAHDEEHRRLADEESRARRDYEQAMARWKAKG